MYLTVTGERVSPEDSNENHIVDVSQVIFGARSAWHARTFT
jgi:hypothetical protein